MRFRSAMSWSICVHFIVLLLLTWPGHRGGKKGSIGDGEDVKILPAPDDGSPITVTVDDGDERLKKRKKHKDCGANWYGGIGIGMTGLDTDALVTDVAEGYPADLAGIKVGDAIKAPGKIRGDVGTKVTVEVIHQGGTSESVTMTREKICYEQRP